MIPEVCLSHERSHTSSSLLQGLRGICESKFEYRTHQQIKTFPKLSARQGYVPYPSSAPMLLFPWPSFLAMPPRPSAGQAPPPDQVGNAIASGLHGPGASTRPRPPSDQRESQRPPPGHTKIYIMNKLTFWGPWFRVLYILYIVLCVQKAKFGLQPKMSGFGFSFCT